MSLYKYIIIICSFFIINSSFSQERTNNIDEKNSTEKIQLINKDIDELKHQRESILADKKILTEEEKSQIKKIDDRINIRKNKLKILNEVNNNN